MTTAIYSVLHQMNHSIQTIFSRVERIENGTLGQHVPSTDHLTLDRVREIIKDNIDQQPKQSMFDTQVFEMQLMSKVDRAIKERMTLFESKIQQIIAKSASQTQQAVPQNSQVNDDIIKSLVEKMNAVNVEIAAIAANVANAANAVNVANAVNALNVENVANTVNAENAAMEMKIQEINSGFEKLKERVKKVETNVSFQQGCINRIDASINLVDDKMKRIESSSVTDDTTIEDNVDDIVGTVENQEEQLEVDFTIGAKKEPRKSKPRGKKDVTASTT